MLSIESLFNDIGQAKPKDLKEQELKEMKEKEAKEAKENKEAHERSRLFPMVRAPIKKNTHRRNARKQKSVMLDALGG